MEHEFIKTVAIVLAAGGFISAVGVITLIIAFRGFGRADEGRRRHLVILGGLVLFVFACCAVLFVISIR